MMRDTFRDFNVILFRNEKIFEGRFVYEDFFFIKVFVFKVNAVKD